jgi:hypothetical protein
MPRRIRLAVITVALVLSATWLVRAQNLGGLLNLSLAVMNAVPPPADDPMFDSFGNVMMDASGHPISDPKEQFHQVKPYDFDPARTYMVEATWVDAIGCITNGFTAVPNMAFTGVASTTPYTDAACPSGDDRDKHNEGLLLSKTGPTANFASGVAELKKVKGITLTSLGYDLRKSGGTTTSPLGSHCGAGAPRFNVTTSDGAVHFIGCNSPPPVVTNVSTGWLRLRWDPITAFPPILPTDVIQRIFIVFDEGTDASGAPDSFGAAILDNIDVNETLVGRGPDN